MDGGNITCPNCGHEFELSDALTGKLRAHLKAELQADVAKREAKVAERTAELEKQEASLEEQIEAALKKRLAEAEEKASKKLEARYGDELKDLQGALAERDSALKEFRKQELDLRKKQRELEEAKEAAELEMTRKLDEERAKIREEAGQKAAEEHRLKDLEKDKVINDLKSSLVDLKRKAEQGSMETQG